MTPESDLVELLGSTADEHLLSAEGATLPHDVGRPEAIPPSSRGRRGIVGAGATLTGVTMVGGIVLFALGAIDALADGSVVARGLMVVGVVLVGTHWGWVHVAELTANSLEARRGRAIEDRNRHWLATIKPYTRHEISTRVEDDGSICIVRSRYRPMRSAARTFTFVCETESEELHSADEAAAAVTERAELLRREAARDTARERERYDLAADAYETALLQHGDEQERRAALRAASAALSEQINANLREPPLIE
jgi:hypothetical protein